MNIDIKEAKELLKKHPKSHLWNKHFSEWCEDDINLLKTSKPKKFRKKYKAIGKQPVIWIKEDGTEERFESLAEVERKLGINECTLRSHLNGRQRTAKGFKFKRA